ncbi:Bug family tripartite tricarboxylate transporter substrate binding protein [Roseococcus sp. YIM B11640]|uniref:Bug family tripartite tricarboxylate transporter substrate binding protein n=1 Tax=Roseococcus sp. YIM B11640 TaxID=3133973 RepID=UPI003C7D94F7
MIRRRDLGLLAGAGLAASPARAQTWQPDRPVRWMVGYPPGGASDIFARLLGRLMSPPLGQNIVVENRPSGGAIVATEAVVRAPADGHMLLHVDNGVLVYNPALYNRLPFDPDKDLVSVGFIGRFPLILLVRNESPHRSFADILAASRDRTLTYATPAVASPHHMAMEVLKRRSGLQAQHVPYRGMPAVMQDLVGGQVDCAIADVTNATPFLADRRVRGLVVMGESRPARAPDVPTGIELGYPDTVAYGWQGISVAAGTPAPAVQRLSAALNQAIQSPEAQRQFADTGAEAVLRTPAEMAEFVQRENAIWRPLIRELGIRLDG